MDGDVLVIVTVVARSAPSGPGCAVVLAVAVIEDRGSVCSAWRFAYWERVPCGWPSVLVQLTTSCWVDSQYTFRSTMVPFCLSSSSTK